jgi:hypothetical protein
MIGCLIFYFTQVDAQTTDEQKQILIGEWNGAWLGPLGKEPTTLIIHEIDAAKAKARCTYMTSSRGEKKYPFLADFTPSPNPKIEFKVEENDLKFILKNKVLEGSFKGMMHGMMGTNTITMEKTPKK